MELISVFARIRKLLVWARGRLRLQRPRCGTELAMRVDRGGAWSAVHMGTVEKDLKPRKGGRSAWGHLNTLRSPHLPPYDELREALSKGVPANLALHVLSMFVLLHKSGAHRNRIEVVTFPAQAIRRNELAATKGEHLIPSLEHCHRDISMDTHALRQGMERRIKGAGVVQVKYTRDELAPLYEIVAGRGLIAPGFERLAQRVFSSRP